MPMNRFTLAQWRKIRGYSQHMMATILGVHINTYIKWEHNSGKMRVENVQKCADVLEISIADIIF